MDRKAYSFLFVGLVAGALLATAVFVGVTRRDKASASRSGAGAPVTVLKLAHVLDQSHPVHAAMDFMARRVGELSGGTVTVKLFPNGQLGSEPETIEQLQRGAVAIVKTSAAAMEGFVPDMALFGLPYLFRDDQHYWTVVDGPIGRNLLAAGEPAGVHGLCFYDSGSRSFYTVGSPILTPADVKERKIRVLPSKMARDLVATLGGGPTPIPFGELYTALQQSMVDGAENNPPSYYTSRHYEVAKFLSLDEHTRVPDVLIFSQKIWLSLTPQAREWINQAVADSVVFQRKLWNEKTAEAIAAVEKAGVKVFRPDKQPFIEATSGMIKQLDGTRLGGIAREIIETK